MPSGQPRSFLIRGIVFIALLSLAFLVRQTWLEIRNVGPIADRFQAALQEKEDRLDQLLNAFERTDSLASGGPELFLKEGLSVFKYKGDQLVYWSNNAVPMELLKDRKTIGRSVQYIGNGYYEVVPRGLNNELIGLILIKEERPYQNKYLQDHFQRDLAFHQDLILAPFGDGGSDIVANDGTALLSLAMPSGSVSSKTQTVLLAMDMLILLAFLFCLESLFNIVQARYGPAIAFAVFAGLIVVGRWVSMSVPLPETGGAALFDPALYATSALLPSLGDLLINVVLLFFTARMLHKARKSTRLVGNGLGLIGAALGLIAFLVLSSFITQTIVGLIENSRIEHNINDVLGVSTFTVISISAMGAMIWSLFVLADVVAELALRNEHEGRVWVLTITLFGASVFVHHYIGVVDIALVLWPLFLLAVPLRVRRNSRGRYDLSASISLLVLASVFSAYVVGKYTDRKERTDRIVFAERLSSDEDPIAELLFEEHLEQLLSTDRIVKEFSKPDSLFNLSAINAIVNESFAGYWSKYAIGVHCFDRLGLPLGRFDKAPERTIEEVHEILKRSQPSDQGNEQLRYLPDRPEEVRYVSWLELEGDTVERIGYVFLEFSNKQIPEELGFPELLLAQDPDRVDDLGEYSFARYENNSLTKTYGDHPYSLVLVTEVKDRPVYFEKDDYVHLAYRADAATVVMLSLPKRPFIEEVTTFSYLFAYFSLVLFIALSIERWRSGERFYSLGLRSKVQVLLVSIVLLSLILLGSGLRYYVTQQYTEKNNALIREKIHSVLIEVSHKMEGEKELTTEHSSYLDHILTKFSNVFFTDINLYDLNGDLLATSRSKVFKEGLIGQKMDPEAYHRLAVERSSEFVHEERIGKLEYLSAYVPFQNKSDEVLAYLNLPYFAKQNELENELSNFLEAIINVFVVLLALSILAGLAVSNWITRPLQLLRAHLTRTDLESSYEPIIYKGSDEIADLVAEYNSKVAELKVSAEKLARSERESAWREMAKQVAHEIKNPLTPMKLSVQHFQRTWNEAEEGSKEKLDQFTEGLVGQIEILANIATEFSNFAKMPAPKKEVLALQDVLQRVVGLYDKSEAVDIEFEPGADDLLVFADNDQMHRVFNNLVKNAIEAIPEGQHGLVEIQMAGTNSLIEIAVRDNGVGIPKERYEQIFVPNFTTRSTGMGLGLAMVKNIVEGSGGSVRFTSEVGKGSSFIVQLPRHQKE